MVKAFGAMNCADCHVSGTGVSVISWYRVMSDGSHKHVKTPSRHQLAGISSTVSVASFVYHMPCRDHDYQHYTRRPATR